jgi:hypothetical protein
LDRKAGAPVFGREQQEAMAMRVWRLFVLIGALGASACAPKREAPAPPRVQQPVQPRPAPAPPPPPPAAVDWSLLPLTAGGWVYNASAETSQAMYGPPNGGAFFVVRCDRARRQVSLWREGPASGNVMTVRTSGGARNLPLSVQAEPLAYVWSALPASDRLLDQIAFSRGRFTVEVPGTQMLVLPSWSEPARVVEDCRG